MKIKLSKKQWELIGKQAKWDKNVKTAQITDQESAVGGLAAAGVDMNTTLDDIEGAMKHLDNACSTLMRIPKKRVDLAESVSDVVGKIQQLRNIVLMMRVKK